MSKHLNQNNRKKQIRRQNGILSVLSLYPDFGMDSEGYPASPMHMIVLLLAGAVFLIAGLVLQKNTLLHLLFCSASFLAAGVYCFVNLFYNFRRGRFVCEGLFVTAACLLGFAAGIYAVSAALMLLYQAVKLIEVRLVRRQHEKARNLLKMLPDSATLIEKKGVRKIKPAHIQAGDLIRVECNEIVPVDGTVEEGVSSLDLSPLISFKKIESVAPGSAVTGGCRNLSVPLLVRAECDYADSTSQKIYSAFLNTTRGENEDEKLSVRVGNLIVPVMLGLSILFALLVPLFTHQWAAGFKRAMVFLLAASPYGLSGALSQAVISAVTEIFANGMVIRDVRILNALAKLETFACNKTGTVTESAYTVSEVCPSGISEERFLSVLSKVESRSSHPIARCICRYTGLAEEDVQGMQITEMPCKGITATVNEHTIYAGNASLLFENGVNCAVPEGQGTAIHLAMDGQYCGYILLENPVREGNFEAIEQLRACGVKNIALLSGDLRSVVRPIAASLNFNVVQAELTPYAKCDVVDYLCSNKTPGHTLAFAGDGVNELTTASHGDLTVTTAALGISKASQADVMILGEGISTFPAAVKAARNLERISFLAVTAHFGVRALCVLLALFGVCPPLLAGLLFSLVGGSAWLFSSVFFSKL